MYRHVVSATICFLFFAFLCLTVNAVKIQKNTDLSKTESKKYSFVAIKGMTYSNIQSNSISVPTPEPTAVPAETPNPTETPTTTPEATPIITPKNEEISETPEIDEPSAEDADTQSIQTSSVWGDVVSASYGSSYGTISCKNIGLYASLIWGDDQSLLDSRAGICQYTGSNQIGYGGCHLLCGHNDSTFSLLQYVSIGDIFTVSTSYGTYVYQVTSAEAGTVAADASTVYSNSTGAALVNLWDSADTLYMYTCYPFGYYNATSQRYVVRAIRI